jgi:hypothetical protein
MRRIDVIMAIWKEEQEFRFYGYEFWDNTGIEFFEVFRNFDLSSAVKVIIGEDFFGDDYTVNADAFIDGWVTEEEMELRMLGWDATLAEEISPEQKAVVIKELSRVREDLQARISELNENGVYFRGLMEMQLLKDLLKELCSSKR